METCAPSSETAVAVEPEGAGVAVRARDALAAAVQSGKAPEIAVVRRERDRLLEVAEVAGGKESARAMTGATHLSAVANLLEDYHRLRMKPKGSSVAGQCLERMHKHLKSYCDLFGLAAPVRRQVDVTIYSGLGAIVKELLERELPAERFVEVEAEFTRRTRAMLGGAR